MRTGWCPGVTEVFIYFKQSVTNAMQARTCIHAHEGLWGYCCSPLISLTLLGASHMLCVRGWAFGQYPPLPRAGRCMRRGTRHFQEVFHQHGPVQSSCLSLTCTDTLPALPVDILWWECPRNNFFRGLLLWQRSIIFEKMIQKSPAWFWRADTASGSGVMARCLGGILWRYCCSGDVRDKL